MAGHGEKLSQRQELAIGALLTAPTLLDAAQQAQLAERTLRRWLHEPQYQAFQAAYRTAKRQVVEQAMAQIQQATGAAVSTLLIVMHDPEAPASARVAAARTVLEQSLKTVEMENLEARIAALEQAQAGSLNGHARGRGFGHG